MDVDAILNNGTTRAVKIDLYVGAVVQANLSSYHDNNTIMYLCNVSSSSNLTGHD